MWGIANLRLGRRAVSRQAGSWTARLPGQRRDTLSLLPDGGCFLGRIQDPSDLGSTTGEFTRSQPTEFFCWAIRFLATAVWCPAGISAKIKASR